MAFITVSREFGSSGTAISQHVAKSLGYDYIDKDIVENVLDQYGLVTFQQFYDAPHTFWERMQDGNQEIIAVFNETVQAFSKTNHGVFVGRAGFVVLRGYENVFHVLIKAPFEDRVTNIMERMHIADRTAAAAMVQQHDKTRERYLKTFYDANQNDSAFFSLVIDTSCVPPETAGKWIVEAARIMEGKKIDPKKSTLSIESDPVMLKTVETVLHPE